MVYQSQEFLSKVLPGLGLEWWVVLRFGRHYPKIHTGGANISTLPCSSLSKSPSHCVTVSIQPTRV